MKLKLQQLSWANIISCLPFISKDFEKILILREISQLKLWICEIQTWWISVIQKQLKKASFSKNELFCHLTS